MPYTIDRELGRGGMGAVFLGHDETGRQAAIKMLSNKYTCYPTYRELFESEVNALKMLNSPGVVKVLGDKYTDSEGNYYVPMEYIVGEDIEHRVNREGPMNYRDAIAMMGEILDAMQDVHNQGIIHRDIKPSNIMIRDNGHICIIDFGIAKDAKVGSTGKTVGTIIGTDGYMSPEQAAGLNIDTRTDIYSLGCVLYFMLTRQQAVKQGSNAQQNINTILNGSMPRPSAIVPDIPRELDEVYLRAVDKNMLNRYNSALEFKNALLSIGNSQQVHYPSQNPQVTVGRGGDNDICVNDPQMHISSHHLTISGLTDNNGNYQIQITDHSSNGTSVDGTKLHRDSRVFNYTGTAQLPEVLMAGLEVGEIQWNHVISLLNRKGWGGQLTDEADGETVIRMDSDDQSSSNNKVELWLLIVSFLVPVVGLAFAIVWRDDYKEKAKQVGLSAIVGIALYLIVVFITLIIINNSL